MSNLHELEQQALADLTQLFAEHPHTVIAYSGGKDSVVAAHLANRIRRTPGVCETSFFYQKQIEDIKQLAATLGIDVEYKDSLDLNWLQRNPQVIFSDNSKVRGWVFLVRQQKTVADYAKRFGFTAAIYGRRTQENTVPSKRYQAKGFEQCHPLREWKEADIWAYFSRHGIPKPWIYGTPHGIAEGNSQFFAMRAKALGSYAKAWEIAHQLDNRFAPTMMGESYSVPS